MRRTLILQVDASADADGIWPIILPVILGLAAVYLLLPRPRPYRAVWGSAAAGLAILLGGWLLIRHQIAFPENVLFYAFSGIAIVAGGLLITQRNPVRAALSFALVVLGTCGLFLLQAAPFLMAATVIVYAGAIIVTFIFVIMLAQQAGPSDADDRSREPLLSCIAGFVLMGSMLFVLRQDAGSKIPSFQSPPFDLAAFDDLVTRTRNAAQENSAGEIGRALRDNEAFQEYRQAVAAGRGSAESRDLAVALDDVRTHWQTWKTAGQAQAMKSKLLQLASLAETMRSQRNANGDPRMPAENVAALGGVLFTDYLIAVELGGTLLLVATIGAIAIAGRRAGELR
jgi:NADH:ubiquinone oxidoreductase subunit 6 (subunit J)